MNLKLGKRPVDIVRYNKRLRLSDYTDISGLLSQIPPDFGNENLFSDWGMLGNDKVGDCVIADAHHRVMLWNKVNGIDVPMTTDGALADYAAITGYNPVTGANDNGTNMQDSMNYGITTGYIDGNNNRHKIVGFVALEQGNWDQLRVALWLFDNVSIGIQFPDTAMVQFSQDKIWDVSRKYKIEGGHDVLIAGLRSSNPQAITWGKVQPMTPRFYNTFNDETYVSFSEEDLKDGKSPEGFDRDTLVSDLQAAPFLK